MKLNTQHFQNTASTEPFFYDIEEMKSKNEVVYLNAIENLKQCKSRSAFFMEEIDILVYDTFGCEFNIETFSINFDSPRLLEILCSKNIKIGEKNIEIFVYMNKENKPDVIYNENLDRSFLEKYSEQINSSIINVKNRYCYLLEECISEIESIYYTEMSDEKIVEYIRSIKGIKFTREGTPIFK